VPRQRLTYRAIVSSAPPSTPVTPSPSSPAPAASSAWDWRRIGDSFRGLLGSTVHLLLDLPMGIVGFVLSLTLLLLGIPLLIVYPIGLVVLFSWLGAVRGLAAFERARIGVLLKSDIPLPPRRHGGGSWHQRFWSSMSDPVTWREFAYLQLLLPLGIFTFSFALLAWSIPLSLLATPVLMAQLGADLTAPGFLMLAIAAPLVGLAALAWLPWMIGALARLDIAVAHAMLGPTERDRLGRRVTELASSRSRMVDATEQERRRIERDLHDGAGQQLVSLAMTLGMAKEKFAPDPEAARALVDEGHQDAKQALATLRNIVRGISPAILSDRGLGAALSAIAARSTVPVALEVNVPHRLHPGVEGIAYYLVCEALANVARHSGATGASVRTVVRGDVLEIEVSDDGRGGADAALGTGLAGLADRVAAVDGRFQVMSPPGGPTVLRAEIPCGPEGE
jgi:signal transduction histidine kinase